MHFIVTSSIKMCLDNCFVVICLDRYLMGFWKDSYLLHFGLLKSSFYWQVRQLSFFRGETQTDRKT